MKTTGVLISFCSFLLLYAPFILSQSEYIDGNSFGLSGGYNYSSNDKLRISGFDFALTFLGSVDLGFQVSEGQTDVQYSSDNVESSGNAVYVAYNFKKREEAINLKVFAGYYSGSTKYFSDKLKSSGALLGLAFYPRLLNEDVVTLRAAIELSYGFLSTTEGNSYYNSDNSQFDNTRSLSAGLNLRIKVSPNISLAFAPFISKDLIHSDNSTFLGLSARLVLSFAMPDND